MSWPFWEYLLAGLIGAGLDLVFGDPRRMPHIVRWAGKLSLYAETLWSRILGRSVIAGFFLWCFVVGIFVTAYMLLSWGLDSIHPSLRLLLDSLLVFQALAYKDLVKHVRDIRKALDEEGIEAARERVSWIVGRDTDKMDANAVCRAAIESGAENLNDAVIAPGFWYVLGGPLGILIYRISNTLDAMVGHRNERFEKLGKFSARVDDFLNFIPARLCSLFLLRLDQWPKWWTLRPDANLHPSFNSGWTEAAMARRLEVVIGGEMWEKGVRVQTEEMNSGARQPRSSDLERCVHQMGETYFKAFGLWLFMALILIVAKYYTGV